MLTALIIAWIVILVVGSAVAGFRGFRVFKRVKRLQAEVERQLPPEKIAEVQARAEALKVKQAELQAAIDSLNRATAQVKIVRDRLSVAVTAVQVRPHGVPGCDAPRRGGRPGDELHAAAGGRRATATGRRGAAPADDHPAGRRRRLAPAGCPTSRSGA